MGSDNQEHSLSLRVFLQSVPSCCSLQHPQWRRHGWVRSAKCELRQDLGTPPHAALISAAHSLMTGSELCKCDIVLPGIGRNPATGEAIQIKASKKVAFRATKELKMAI